MANDTNSVIVIGRLTRDAQLKYTIEGTAVTKFSLAINRYGGKDKQDEVSFVEFVLWGTRAESLDPFLKKGRQICVQGELRQNRWEQDGQNRSKIEIYVENIQLLGGDQTKTSSPPQASRRAEAPTNKPVTPPQPRKEPVQRPFPEPEEFDDDIPF